MVSASALRQTDDLSRVHLASHPMVARIGFSPTAALIRISGTEWMEVSPISACQVLNFEQSVEQRPLSHMPSNPLFPREGQSDKSCHKGSEALKRAGC